MSKDISIEKLDLHSPDLVTQNFEKLAVLFPNCVTENAEGKSIDFDLLKQELSHKVIDGPKERYRLEWPGKREAIVTANLPTTKTLRPVREDSMSFDTTENLYIEGDNLEVLKLLQESYLGKVKMIYIDPPYNTGKDFVYKDNFSQDTEEYKAVSGQADEFNQRLVANPETAGRYHSDWLTMLYPRLKLARNLLTVDGVIFISIDDNEVHNLKKVCDEIFGEQNFITEFIWQKKTGSADANNVAIITEYILAFSKRIEKLKLNQDNDAHDEKRFKYKDEFYEERGPFYYDNLDRGTLGYHKSLDYGVAAPDGDVIFPNGRIQQFNDGWRWKWGREKLEWGLKNGFIEIQKSSTKESGWGVYYKIYLKVNNDGDKITRSTPYKNLLQGILNTHASSEAKELFGKAGVFSNPKPVNLIKQLLLIGSGPSDLVLDFFSGSATTAHAVLKLNSEDGGRRKFIQVQLPEIIEEKAEAFREGYNNLCEIGKERIRRAARKIQEETKADIDYGFRVYRLDDSNMQDVYYTPQDYNQANLDLFADNVKSGRTADDLLAQVMLDWGLPLSSKIEQSTINGKKLFKVSENSLYACFDKGIDEDFARTISKDAPLRIVFRDSGFKNDTAKTNVKQLLRQLSPETEMKVI